MKTKRLAAALLGSAASALVLSSFFPLATATEFELDDISGTYAFFLTGEITQGPVTGPFDAIGLIEADGEGNFPFATRTINLAGQVIVQNDTATGTYTVNPDGTGSAVFQPTAGGPPVPFDLVVKNRREFLAIATSVGVTGYGLGTRQD